MLLLGKLTNYIFLWPLLWKGSPFLPRKTDDFYGPLVAFRSMPQAEPPVLDDQLEEPVAGLLESREGPAGVGQVLRVSMEKLDSTS